MSWSDNRRKRGRPDHSNLLFVSLVKLSLKSDTDLYVWFGVWSRSRDLYFPDDFDRWRLNRSKESVFDRTKSIGSSLITFTHSSEWIDRILLNRRIVRAENNIGTSWRESCWTSSRVPSLMETIGTSNVYDRRFNSGHRSDGVDDFPRDLRSCRCIDFFRFTSLQDNPTHVPYRPSSVSSERKSLRGYWRTR